MTAAPLPGLHLLGNAERERLQRLLGKHGLSEVAKLLGVTRGVIAAAAAGSGVRRGSVELLREALGKLNGEDK